MRFMDLAAVASVVAVLHAPRARAGTVTYTGYNVLNNQNVTLSDTAIGIFNVQGGSGQISYTGVTGTTDPLLTWCVDIQDELQGAGSFTAGIVVGGSIADEVNALITNVTPTLETNYDASAALQVSIWEAEYGPDLSVSTPANVATLASGYLANVRNGAWTADPTMGVAVLVGVNGNQDQAYLTPVPVPEPVSLSLLGGVLLGSAVLTHVARRRSSQRGSGHPASMSAPRIDQT